MKKLLLTAVMILGACSDTLSVDLSNTTVELDAFSGLPNPRWQLTETEEEALERKLQELPATAPGALPDVLGYRGFRIVDENGVQERITVTRNGFIIKHENSGDRWYEDKHRAELYLMQTAQARGYGSVLAN